MPKKKNKSGQLQEYDPHTGRYVNELSLLKIDRRYENKFRNEMLRREDLENRARKSKDHLLYETFQLIEDFYPGTVKKINFLDVDRNGKTREFDMETRNHIIEIKSGNARRCLNQFIEQKAYVEDRRKRYLVFAPHILKGARLEYEKHGIIIVTSTDELIRKLGEKR